MSINPEMACAHEMARILKFPAMITIDTFAKGRVEILQFKITEKSPLAGIQLKDISKYKKRILVCAVERSEEEIYIPSGNFTIQAGDKIRDVYKRQEGGVAWNGNLITKSQFMHRS